MALRERDGDYLIYVRRSVKREGDADVSDETQIAVARSRLPDGVEVEVLADSGGHHSGYNDQRPAYQELLARLRTGRVVAIAAYDLSRLHRNTENALALLRAERGCEATHGSHVEKPTATTAARWPTVAVCSRARTASFGRASSGDSAPTMPRR